MRTNLELCKWKDPLATCVLDYPKASRAACDRLIMPTVRTLTVLKLFNPLSGKRK